MIKSEFTRYLGGSGYGLAKETPGGTWAKKVLSSCERFGRVRCCGDWGVLPACADVFNRGGSRSVQMKVSLTPCSGRSRQQSGSRGQGNHGGRPVVAMEVIVDVV